MLETANKTYSKQYFSISEAAEHCGVKPSVLRYWESEFSSLSPAKRRGGRRYYQPEDIDLALSIKDLLYRQGFTIQGARARLTQQKKQKKSDDSLQKIIADLKQVASGLVCEIE